MRFFMFLTYFKIYYLFINVPTYFKHLSEGSRKRFKSDDKKGYNFNCTITIIHVNSHLSNNLMVPEILRACNDQKIILEIRKDLLGKKKDV